MSEFISPIQPYPAVSPSLPLNANPPPQPQPYTASQTPKEAAGHPHTPCQFFLPPLTCSAYTQGGTCILTLCLFYLGILDGSATLPAFLPITWTPELRTKTPRMCLQTHSSKCCSPLLLQSQVKVKAPTLWVGLASYGPSHLPRPHTWNTPGRPSSPPVPTLLHSQDAECEGPRHALTVSDQEATIAAGPGQQLLRGSTAQVSVVPGGGRAAQSAPGPSGPRRPARRGHGPCRTQLSRYLPSPAIHPGKLRAETGAVPGSRA